MLQDLRRRGLDVERARRMVELCWQMRRAFYFIGRELPGRSQSMRALRESLWRALFTHDLRRYEARLWNRMEDFSILLLGETGTGKGAAAAALGRSGFLPWDERRGTFAWDFGDGFVPVHLTEHPENLFESALFGHRRGAFTGAVADHDGVLARCRPHGVVFLDEIGEVTLPMQVKLLRVLQERTYTPVGSSEPRRFAGRILAATHRSPDELRRSGALRNDFYFRLSTHTIVLPPLRQRIVEEPGELQALVEVIASRIVGAGLGGEIAAVLRRDLGPGYGFPGNVRELEQLVRVVLIEGACRPDRPEGDRGAFWDAARRGEIDAEGFLDQWCAELLGRFGSYVDVARRTGLDRRTVKRRAIRGAQNGQAPAT
jgi:DNA-binding NtrC family response regulator